MSPKLSNSSVKVERRLKIETLRTFNSCDGAHFKFVAATPEDLLEVEKLVGDAGLYPEKIIIMPECRDAETQSQRLEALVHAVQVRGWRLLPRMHVLIWGARRGV